jgi:hypothetical protein
MRTHLQETALAAAINLIRLFRWLSGERAHACFAISGFGYSGMTSPTNSKRFHSPKKYEFIAIYIEL